jgi:hypothetical protein
VIRETTFNFTPTSFFAILTLNSTTQQHPPYGYWQCDCDADDQEFFLELYRGRIKKKSKNNNNNSALTPPEVLAHLLEDVKYYQGRHYAYWNPPGDWKLEVGALVWEAIGVSKPSEYMLICETLSSRHRSFKETYENATPSEYYRKGSLGYLIDISRSPSSSGLGIQKYMLSLELGPYEQMLKDKGRGLFIITDL